MFNNDIVIRLRYALDLKDAEMVEIFKLGGVRVTKEDVLKMMEKTNKEEEVKAYRLICNNSMLESFLNGFITLRRGKLDTPAGQSERPVYTITDNKNVNNVVLKKLKIALNFTSEDMLSVFELAENPITKGELSAVFRKEGHRNYKDCGDSYIRNFLKGLAIKYRKNSM